MANAPLRPCRHPGCPELTREGWCPKHRPQHRRRVSAEYHGMYNLPIWTDKLRSCCASRSAASAPGRAYGPGPLWWTTSGRTAGTGRCSSTGRTTRACVSTITTARRRWNRPRTGGNSDGSDRFHAAEASPAPAGVHARDAYGERPRPRADMVMTLPLGVENPGGAPWIPRVASNAKKFPRSGDG